MVPLGGVVDEGVVALELPDGPDDETGVVDRDRDGGDDAAAGRDGGGHL